MGSIVVVRVVWSFRVEVKGSSVILVTVASCQASKNIFVSSYSGLIFHAYKGGSNLLKPN